MLFPNKNQHENFNKDTFNLFKLYLVITLCQINPLKDAKQIINLIKNEKN